MTTQHRTKGKSTEAYFLYRYYNWAPDCSYTLAEHHLDYGVDFILPNGKRIQVKRFNYNKGENQNPWRCDLRRKQNKGTGNYTKNSFDFLVIHDHEGATGHECLRYAKMSELISIKTGEVKLSHSVNKMEEIIDFSVFFQ
jgi:hypothetical protein